MRLSKYLVLSLFLLVVSCGRDRKENSFSIRGQFSNAAGDMVILGEMDVHDFVRLDSAVIGEDGTISFTHDADQPGFYFLQFAKGERMILLMEQKENLTVRGDLRDKPEALILEGSPGTILLQDFFKASSLNRMRVDSVKAVLLQHEGSEDFLGISMKADSAFSKITEDQRKLERDFIDRNPNSLASLIVLNYSFGFKPVLTPETDLAYYRKLTGLAKLYPSSKHVLFHLKRMSVIEEEIGMKPGRKPDVKK